MSFTLVDRPPICLRICATSFQFARSAGVRLSAATHEYLNDSRLCLTNSSRPNTRSPETSFVPWTLFDSRSGIATTLCPLLTASSTISGCRQFSGSQEDDVLLRIKKSHGMFLNVEPCQFVMPRATTVCLKVIRQRFYNLRAFAREQDRAYLIPNSPSDIPPFPVKCALNCCI